MQRDMAHSERTVGHKWPLLLRDACQFQCEPDLSWLWPDTGWSHRTWVWEFDRRSTLHTVFANAEPLRCTVLRIAFFVQLHSACAHLWFHPRVYKLWFGITFCLRSFELVEWHWTPVTHRPLPNPKRDEVAWIPDFACIESHFQRRFRILTFRFYTEPT